MKNVLEEARNKINKIDEEIVRLFEERMKTVIKVATYKKENNLPIFDSVREQTLLGRNLDFLNDKELAPYYQEFFRALLKVSKDYQKIIIEN